MANLTNMTPARAHRAAPIPGNCGRCDRWENEAENGWRGYCPLLDRDMDAGASCSAFRMKNDFLGMANSTRNDYV